MPPLDILIRFTFYIIFDYKISSMIEAFRRLRFHLIEKDYFSMNNTDDYIIARDIIMPSRIQSYLPALCKIKQNNGRC